MRETGWMFEGQGKWGHRFLLRRGLILDQVGDITTEGDGSTRDLRSQVNQKWP